MELQWMGSYRVFVEALVRFGNVYSQLVNLPGFITSSAYLSAAEIQVLEYILENEEKHQKMAEIAQRLWIPQSTFSKMVKQLVSKGLLEKYRINGNHKNVIVKVSALGREVYREYAEHAVQGRWGKLFSTLDEVPSEAVEVFTRILNDFSDGAIRQLEEHNRRETGEDSLIRIE